MNGKNGYLTTHVLDTANGIPAAGVAIELFGVKDGVSVKLSQTRTNADGRTDAPLLPKGGMAAGDYELAFRIGDYFEANGTGGAKSFIDIVPIRFRIVDENAHYHVPLLVSPFAYSTYRGS